MYIEKAYLGKSPKWLYLFLTFLVLLMIGFSVLFSFFVNMEQILKAQIAQKGELVVLFENLITFLVFFMLLLLWVRFVHQQPLLAFTTSRKKIDWKRFFFSFGLWSGFVIISLLADYIISPQDYVFNFQWKPFLLLFLISTLLIPFQAGFEEYLFRGYLMQGLGVLLKNRWFPLLFSSITFGLMHIANPEIEKLGYDLLFYYIGTGLFLGCITLIDEGIELAMGFHIANNLITALLVTSDWTVFQTPSLFRDISEPTLIENIFVQLIVLVIFAYILAKKYKWTGYKEKLFGKVKTEKEFLESIS